MSLLDALWLDESTIRSTLRLGRTLENDKYVMFCGFAAEEINTFGAVDFRLGLGAAIRPW